MVSGWDGMTKVKRKKLLQLWCWCGDFCDPGKQNRSQEIESKQKMMAPRQMVSVTNDRKKHFRNSSLARSSQPTGEQIKHDSVGF